MKNFEQKRHVNSAGAAISRLSMYDAFFGLFQYSCIGLLDTSVLVEPALLLHSPFYFSEQSNQAGSNSLAKQHTTGHLG
jgi:hypothetical protein